MTKGRNADIPLLHCNLLTLKSFAQPVKRLQYQTQLSWRMAVCMRLLLGSISRPRW